MPLQYQWGLLSCCHGQLSLAVVCLLLSSCALLVGYSLVVVCGLFSSYGEGLFSCNIYGELSLIAMCRGLLSCCGGGAHLNFPQSDFSLCIMSGGLLSHCGWWLLLRSGGVLCLTWALASGLLLSCSGSSSKVVMRGSEGVFSSFGTGCSYRF